MDIGFLVTGHCVKSSDVANFGDRFYNKSVRHWFKVTNVAKINVECCKIVTGGLQMLFMNESM